MTDQAEIAVRCHTLFPATSEVAELMLLLPLNQLSALEVVAGRLNMTVGQLLRRLVSDFLRQGHAR